MGTSQRGNFTILISLRLRTFANVHHKKLKGNIILLMPPPGLSHRFFPLAASLLGSDPSATTPSFDDKHGTLGADTDLITRAPWEKMGWVILFQLASAKFPESKWAEVGDTLLSELILVAWGQKCSNEMASECEAGQCNGYIRLDDLSSHSASIARRC